jgi:L-arabinose isomerase
VTPSTKQIWFLTGSQHLYGPEVLGQVADQSRTISDVLAKADGIPAEVVAKPVLTDSDAIRRVMIDASADDDCIGVIAWMHTFSPAKMWITGLDLLRKPLLHLHTQVDKDLPWGSIDMDFMNLNQAAHGDREFGYVQTRIGLRRKTISGHVSDPRVIERVATWARAANAVNAVDTLRLVRFGDNMRNVAVTDGDKVEAELRLGVSVNTYGVNDLVERVDAVTGAEIDDLVAEYEDDYDVAAELRRGGDRHESLRYAAAIEVGLRGFLVDGATGRSRRTSRTSAACASSRAWPSSG